jgi:hypothetical protein
MNGRNSMDGLRRPIRVVADFPEKPKREFGVRVYGSHNPFMLRALSAHYGVSLGGFNVKAGEAEYSLERVLDDLHAADLELLVWGPGDVLIDVVVGTAGQPHPEPRPNAFGIAFYVEPRARMSTEPSLASAYGGLVPENLKRVFEGGDPDKITVIPKKPRS